MIETIQTADLAYSGQNICMADGFQLSDRNVQDICSYYKVPATLIAIDKKYGTKALLEVACKETATIQYRRLSDKAIQIMDPKSTFTEDEEFEKLIAISNEVGEMEPTRRGDGRVMYTLPGLDSDIFMNDNFTRELILERLPQGGINVSADTVRVICTNGAKITDSILNSFSRKGKLGKGDIFAVWDALKNYSIEDQMRQRFSALDGTPLPASVSDYWNMRSCLKSITDEDVANELFPFEPIENFYQEQGLNLGALSKSKLDSLTSGLTYYECFNILTNGAKQAENSLENRIKVSKFFNPIHRHILENYTHINGQPMFLQEDIQYRMGDVA